MRPKPNSPTTGETVDEATETEYYVLGGGHTGAFVARRLRARGHRVNVVDEAHESSDVRGIRGDPSDVVTLESIGLSESSTVIVTSPHDGRNLLIAQLARVHFDVPRVLVLTNVPERRDALTAAGHEPICATTALSDAVVDSV